MAGLESPHPRGRDVRRGRGDHATPLGYGFVGGILACQALILAMYLRPPVERAEVM